MLYFFLFLSLCKVLVANDLNLGQVKSHSRKILSEFRVAKASIWPETEFVGAETPIDEVISYINVTDLRPGKDGRAFLAGGGVRQRNVIIALKGPTIPFQGGFRFYVEVLADKMKNV